MVKLPHRAIMPYRIKEVGFTDRETFVNVLVIKMIFVGLRANSQ